MPRRNKKMERRTDIMNAALNLWAGGSYRTVNMSEVAETAGVAKGTLYLYFETKEHLFLALLEEQFDAWFEHLDSALDEAGKWDPARVLRVLVASVDHRDGLTGLQCLLESVLEQNLDLETARSFKQRLLEHSVSTGARLEQRLSFLRPGHGVRFLMHFRAVLTGLRQMADVSPVVKQVIAENPQMRVFDVDFRKESSAAIQGLIEGFHGRL